MILKNKTECLIADYNADSRPAIRGDYPIRPFGLVRTVDLYLYRVMFTDKANYDVFRNEIQNDVRVHFVDGSTETMFQCKVAIEAVHLDTRTTHEEATNLLLYVMNVFGVKPVIWNDNSISNHRSIGNEYYETDDDPYDELDEDY